MVNRSISEFLIFVTPGLASAAVAGAAWWTRPGRAALRTGKAAAISVARAAVERWIPVALAALISITLGVVAYAGHTLDVSSGRALHGAVIALLASAGALAIYWAMGRFVRQIAMLVGLWALSLVPLYYYAFFALVVVVTYTQCAPGNSDCPFG
jgi:hypothetical protein